MNKAMQFLLRGLLMTTMLFAVSAVQQGARHSQYARWQERPHVIGRLRRAGHPGSALASCGL